MIHVFSFGVWGSLHLSVSISMPRQSKLSESKQLWDWPGLVMEPPSKKAQIPSFGPALCYRCLMIQKETGGFAQNDADVGLENATYYNTWGRFSPRIGMSCHFIPSSIMQWCSHYDLQGKDEFLCESSKAGTLAAFRHFNATMSRNYKCIQSTPCKK